MSKEKKSSKKLIWIFVLAMEAVCMIVISISVFVAKTRYYTSNSISKIYQEKQPVILCSVTSIKELSKEDMLVRHVVQEGAEDYHYFVCSIEVENGGADAVDYLSLEARDQNDTYLPCYPADYYQEVKNMNEVGESDYHYGIMMIPEYSMGQYDVVLAIGEEQLKDMEELTFSEWTYRETDEDIPNEVSCVWEDVLTSSPVQ